MASNHKQKRNVTTNPHNITPCQHPDKAFRTSPAHPTQANTGDSNHITHGTILSPTPTKCGTHCQPPTPAHEEIAPSVAAPKSAAGTGTTDNPPHWRRLRQPLAHSSPLYTKWSTLSRTPQRARPSTTTKAQVIQQAPGEQPQIPEWRHRTS